MSTATLVWIALEMDVKIGYSIVGVTFCVFLRKEVKVEL